MLKIRRVCVPLGLACNLQCRYCLRDMGRSRVPRLNDLMRRYVAQLDPSETEALIVTGGEPLLYRNRMLELFEINPRIHRKLMTNGLLLDQSIIDYCNANRIEVMLSHDGVPTEYLRGVDVLRDRRIVALLRQIEILRINAVATKLNPDCIETYRYIVDHLGREDFFMTFNPCFDTGEVKELIEGFDYAKFNRTFAELFTLIPNAWAFNARKPGSFSLGVNVLPDGSVVSMATMRKYGTVENSAEEIRAAVEQAGEYDRCYASRCPQELKMRCIKQLASPHFCRVRFGQAATADQERL